MTWLFVRTFLSAIKCVCVNYVRMNIILRSQQSYIYVRARVDRSLFLSLFLLSCVQYPRNQGETFFASSTCNMYVYAQPIRQILCNQPIIFQMMFSMSIFLIIMFEEKINRWSSSILKILMIVFKTWIYSKARKWHLSQLVMKRFVCLTRNN